MMANHMLQVLSLVAMEPPTSIEADSVRDEKLKILQSLKPLTDGTLASQIVRGQYRAGASAGGAVPGYLEELGSDTSKTETYVALKAEIGSWRWNGSLLSAFRQKVPSRLSEIVVEFKPVPIRFRFKCRQFLQHPGNPPAARGG